MYSKKLQKDKQNIRQTQIVLRGNPPKEVNMLLLALCTLGVSNFQEYEP